MQVLYYDLNITRRDNWPYLWIYLSFGPLLGYQIIYLWLFNVFKGYIQAFQAPIVFGQEGN